ncbi:hypothetical protein L211DRAFT_108723 [Terfezia boudieri ATCC MYA-4762]|uniref:Uncharacterized protein n=1 Tax=Terfezia boudieri ATCC MYA-4762 TaxID=1051890 RepID=A0A3N4LUN5_9PEZI|nr:hypothetical protein L211DRAFT_108723 [Terfezia boudieri ATCC MYA-4762]
MSDTNEVGPLKDFYVYFSLIFSVGHETARWLLSPEDAWLAPEMGTEVRLMSFVGEGGWAGGGNTKQVGFFPSASRTEPRTGCAASGEVKKKSGVRIKAQLGNDSMVIVSDGARRQRVSWAGLD